MQKKIVESFFCFWDNSIWIGWLKLSVLRREYFQSALSMLGKSLEIFHITNRDFLQVNRLQRDHYIWERCCHANFNNVSARLPCCFGKDPLKRDFVAIDLTLFFGLRNFGNTSARRVILFFWEYSKLKRDFKNAEKKLRKGFLFSM